jgi:hypothetical protein
MDQIPANGKSPQMINEEFADQNRKMAKRAVRNMLIVFGVKWAIIYSINRWAKTAAKNNLA